MGIKASLVLAVVKKRFPNPIKFYIEYLQILILIPVIHLFFPNKILAFFRVIRHALLQFEFMKLDGFIYGSYYYDRADFTMRSLGFRSQSAIINLTNWLIILPILFTLYCLIYFYIEKKIYQKAKGFIMSPIRRFVNWMVPGIFIHWINISFILVVFLSYYEVHNHSNKGKYKWSWYTSLLIISLWVIYIITVIILSLLMAFNEKFKDANLKLKAKKEKEPGIFEIHCDV